MTTLINIELTCPVCDARFESRRIASTNSVGQDTDFRPKTEGIDPQPHYVHVCPDCLFAAFEGDFGTAEETVRRYVLAGEHNADEFTEGASDGAALNGSAKYILAARCYSMDSRASDLRLADLQLRASWCARQEGRAAREHEAQCEAILLFEKAVAADEVAEDQLKMILYLLGELYRRVGRHELAIALFDQAELAPESSDTDVRFEGLITRQRAAAQASLAGNMEIDAG